MRKTLFVYICVVKFPTLSQISTVIRPQTINERMGEVKDLAAPKCCQSLYIHYITSSCKRRRFVKMHVAENSNPLLFTNNVHRLISKINSLLYFAANRDFNKLDVVCLYKMIHTV